MASVIFASPLMRSVEKVEANVSYNRETEAWMNRIPKAAYTSEFREQAVKLALTEGVVTALILSAYDNHPETLKTLLAAGANACAADRNGNTALMGALFKGHTNIAMMLLDTHCDIDQTNNAGETALSFAALFGRLDMIPVLAARGANVNHVDARGATALQMAIAQHNPAVENALRHVGATQ
jgi:ankyrin repeat protein